MFYLFTNSIPCFALLGDTSAIIGLQGALKFNGGGHLNHSIFWQNLTPGGTGEPAGALAEAIDRDFGSFAAMKEKLSAATVAVQVKNRGSRLFSRFTK